MSSSRRIPVPPTTATTNSTSANLKKNVSSSNQQQFPQQQYALAAVESPAAPGTPPVVNQAEMTFVISPPEVEFSHFKPHTTYEATLSFKNQTRNAKYIRALQPESRFFRLSEPKCSSSTLKVAPGLSLSYTVYFTPEEDADYECDLIVLTEHEKFVVPVRALGSRGRLVLPAKLDFGRCPIKAASRSTILLSNTGTKPCDWKARATEHFRVVPEFATIEPEGSKQVAVEFTPTKMGPYRGTLFFDVGPATQQIPVRGESAEVDIGLSTDNISLGQTFIGLERQGIVRVANNSDATLEYKWRNYATDDEDRAAIGRLMVNNGLSEEQATANALTFEDEVFTVEPINGSIPAKGAREFIITFNPQLATTYVANAYLDIQGKRERLPVTIRGSGLGPQCSLSFDSLDLGDIFISSIHEYTLSIDNRGSIDATFVFMPQNTLFGPKFRFTPNTGVIPAGATQEVQISFSSDVIGIVSETFRIHVQGSRDELLVHFKGRVIGPTFHFDAEELDFGNVSYNFWHTKTFNLVNTSEIPMGFKLRVPEDGVSGRKEFEVTPSMGEILPHGKQKIQVDFLSNTVQEYNAHLVVDIDDVGENLDQLPIKATCIVPDIVISCNSLDFNRDPLDPTKEKCPCVDFPKDLDVELRNDTALSAKYEFILPTDDDPIRKKVSVSIGSGDPKDRKGVVHARSTQRVKVWLKGKQTGHVHFPLYVRILGSEHPPHYISVTARISGPNIVVQPQSIDFGVVDVLTEKPYKQIVLANHSPIPAHFSCRLTGRQIPNVVHPFSLTQFEGVIQPDSTANVRVHVYLDEAMKFVDEVEISVVHNGVTERVPVTATGRGFPVVPSIPLELVDFGNNFTTNEVKKEFVLENRGRRQLALQWSNSRGSKAKEGEDPICFTITPERAVINSKSSEKFLITGLSNAAGEKFDDFVCKMSQTHKLIATAKVRGNFQPPLLQKSTNRMEFTYTYGSDQPDSALTTSRPLTLKNISLLNLQFTVRIHRAGSGEPCAFSLDQSDIVLPPGENITVNVYFNAAYRGDRVSHKTSTKVVISYSNHEQKDHVTLSADIHFPNLVIDDKSLDFACILNDTEHRRTITLTNPSRIPVSYNWVFEEEADPSGAVIVSSRGGKRSDSNSIVPSNNVFDFIPFRGVIEAGATERVDVLFTGVEKRKFAANAICQVQGGPEYPLAITAEASNMSYKFDKVLLDYGQQEYDTWQTMDVVLTNTGKVPFLFQVDLSPLQRPGMIEVIPMSAPAPIKGSFKIQVRFSPRVPDIVDDSFNIQVAHFEPQVFNVKGIGLYSSIVLSSGGTGSHVERNDPPQFAEYIKKAQERKMAEFVAANASFGSAATPTTTTAAGGAAAGAATQNTATQQQKHRDAVVSPSSVLGDAERMYFRDIVTEDARAMRRAANAAAAAAQQQKEQQQQQQKEQKEQAKTATSASAAVSSSSIIALRNQDSASTPPSSVPLTPSTQSLQSGVRHSNLALLSTDLKEDSSLPQLESDRLSENNDDSSGNQQNAVFKAPEQPHLGGNAEAKRQLWTKEIKYILSRFTLDMGNIVRGDSRKRQVKITNTSATSVLFNVDRKWLSTNGVISVTPDKFSKVPVGGSIVVDVLLNTKIKGVSIGDFKGEVIFDVKGGPLVVLEVKAFVVVPALDVKSRSLDFGRVQVGLTRVLPLVIENTQLLPAEWNASFLEEGGNRLIRRRDPLRDDSKRKFFVTPEKGVLQPGSRTVLSVSFSPAASETFKQKLQVRVSSNPRVIDVSCGGEGEELSLEIAPSFITLPPVLPFQQYRQAFRLTNHSSVPIEVYSFQFDKKYLIEEEILRHAAEEDVLLLPPREIGASLPDFLMEAYFSKLVAADSALLSGILVPEEEQALAPLEGDKPRAVEPSSPLSPAEEASERADLVKPIVVVVTGPPLSGKSVLASHLVDKYTFQKVSIDSILYSAMELDTVEGTALRSIAQRIAAGGVTSPVLGFGAAQQQQQQQQQLQQQQQSLAGAAAQQSIRPGQSASFGGRNYNNINNAADVANQLLAANQASADAALISCVIKQRLRSFEGGLGVVIDDLTCTLSPNPEAVLLAIKDAATACGFPLRCIVLSMDEPLINLRRAHIDRDSCALRVKDATVQPLTEDAYDRLPDAERREHDAALLRLRHARKELQKAEDTVTKLEGVRKQLLADEKIFSLDQEIEKEMQEEIQRAEEERAQRRRPHPGGKRTVGGPTGLGAVGSLRGGASATAGAASPTLDSNDANQCWEELAPIKRFKRTYVMSKQILDNVALQVIRSDNPLDEVQKAFLDALPLARNQDGQPRLPTDGNRLATKIDFTVPDPVTKQRLFKPREKRNVPKIPFFKILTPKLTTPPTTQEKVRSGGQRGGGGGFSSGGVAAGGVGGAAGGGVTDKSTKADKSSSSLTVQNAAAAAASAQLSNLPPNIAAALQPPSVTVIDNAFTQESRWILQPKSTVELTLQFVCDQNLPEISETLTFGIVGSTQEFPISIKSASSVPEILRDPRNIFGRKIRTRPDEKTGALAVHQYILSKKQFEFGPLIVRTPIVKLDPKGSKSKSTAAAASAASAATINSSNNASGKGGAGSASPLKTAREGSLNNNLPAVPTNSQLPLVAGGGGDVTSLVGVGIDGSANSGVTSAARANATTDKLHFTNCGQFPAEVSLYFENERSKVFAVQPSIFVLGVGESLDVTLSANPDNIGELKNTVVAVIKDNPDPLTIDVSCQGTVPELQFVPEKSSPLLSPSSTTNNTTTTGAATTTTTAAAAAAGGKTSASGGAAATSSSSTGGGGGGGGGAKDRHGEKEILIKDPLRESLFDFGRMLVKRKEERKIVAKNTSLLPVSWKLVGTEKLPEEMRIEPIAGTAEPGKEFTITASFASDRGASISVPLKLEVCDRDDASVQGEALPVTVKAEAHDVVVEFTKDVNFGMVRVGEAKKEVIKIGNKGPYEVLYQFRLSKKLSEILTIVPSQGSLRGTAGFKDMAITNVEVVWKADREVLVGLRAAGSKGSSGSKSSTILSEIELSFLDPVQKILVSPLQQIPVKGEALFNKFQIKPATGINFGPCLYRQKKQATFDIVNTGSFETKFRLFNYKDGLQRALELAAEQQPKKPVARNKQKQNDQPDGEVTVGTFVVSPSFGAIPVGGTQTVSVSITPEGNQSFAETLGIHIEDRDPTLHPAGVPFRLQAESCIPGIVADLDAPESDAIFEEQQIVSRLEGRKMVSCYSREERTFSFGIALCGRKLTERLRLSNPGKVSCTVVLKILPRADGADAKAMADAFDIQLARPEDNKIVIGPHEHRYVTIGFTPNNLNTFGAFFEATVDGGTDAKTRQLRLELRGEGSLPNVILDIPPPPAKPSESLPFGLLLFGGEPENPKNVRKGGAGAATRVFGGGGGGAGTGGAISSGTAPGGGGGGGAGGKGKGKDDDSSSVPPNTLVLPRTIIGTKVSRTLTVRNVGDLPAVVRFSLSSVSAASVSASAAAPGSNASNSSNVTGGGVPGSHYFTFPNRNEDKTLAPGAIERYSVFFEPMSMGDFTAKLTMIVQDNHYEDTLITLMGTGYVEDLTFADVDENTENRLTLSDAYIGQPKMRTFSLRNHSQKNLRVEWVTTNPALRISPRILHLSAGSSKQCDALFSSEVPVAEVVKCSAVYQQIELAHDQPTDWDDRQTTTRWIVVPPSEMHLVQDNISDGGLSDNVNSTYSSGRGMMKKLVEPVAEPSFTIVGGGPVFVAPAIISSSELQQQQQQQQAGANANANANANNNNRMSVSARGGSHHEALQSMSHHPLDQHQQQPGGGGGAKKRGGVDKEDPNSLQLPPNASSKELLVACICDYVQYDTLCPEDPQAFNRGIMFKMTKLFASRKIAFTIKNTGKVALPCSLGIKTVNREEVVGDDAGTFSVAPSNASIAPLQSLDVVVTYQPLTAGTHKQLLVANFPHSLKPELVVPLQGTGECPLVHIDLPVSEYISTRDSDMPPVDPSSLIVEFFSRGIRIRNTVRFLVLNPSNLTHTFEWEEVRSSSSSAVSAAAAASAASAGKEIISSSSSSSAAGSYFKCNTVSGTIHSGKRYEMVFEFNPDVPKLRESVWKLNIHGKMSVPFLLVGHVTEPDVFFSTTKLQFGQVIVGARTKQVLTLENRESIAYPFTFDRLPAQSAVEVNPTHGTVPPGGSLPIEITFTPLAEEQYNCQLLCHVKKAVAPLTCNIKGEGFTTHDVLKMQTNEGAVVLVPAVGAAIATDKAAATATAAVAVTASSSSSNHFDINLGRNQVHAKVVRKFWIANNGRYNFDFKWTVPVHPFITLSPAVGTVHPNSDVPVELVFNPTKETTIGTFHLVCKVTNGSTYSLRLGGSATVPNVVLSKNIVDFGPCFVRSISDPAEVMYLSLTNKDSAAVSVDCPFENNDFLELDSTSFLLGPGEKRDIRLSFAPRDTIPYVESLQFTLNDLIKVNAVVRGEGCVPKIDVQNRSVRFGIARVGDRKEAEVKLTCRSKIDTKVSLMKAVTPALSKLGLLVNNNDQEFVMRPKESRSITVSFRPHQRISPFNQDVFMEVMGQELPFCQISGSCHGAEVHLDQKSVQFGHVVLGTKVTKKVTIMNTGDLGLQYTWNDKKLGADFTITPNHGYISAHTDQVCDITFAPTEANKDYRRDAIELRFDEAPSLTFAISSAVGSERPPVQESVAFNCRVRETITNKVTVRNDTPDTWVLRPAIDNSVWTTSEQLVVRGRESADCVITYSPMTCTKTRLASDGGATDVGTIFFPLPTGNALLFRLEGTSDHPAPAAAPVEREILTKTTHVEKFIVANWLKVPQRFSATPRFSNDPTDESIVVKGVGSVEVPPLSSREYKLQVSSYKETRLVGSIVFANEVTKEYQYYNATFIVRASIPAFGGGALGSGGAAASGGGGGGAASPSSGKAGGTTSSKSGGGASSFESEIKDPAALAAILAGAVELKTFARGRKIHEISIHNPLGKQVTLLGKCDNTELFVPASFAAPPKSTVKIPVEFFPLLAKESPVTPARVIYSCAELGEFVYTFALSSTAAPPEKPQRLQCPLGTSVTTSIRFNHYCRTATDFQFKFQDPKQTAFAKANSQSSIKVPAAGDPRLGSEVSVDITFEPTRIGDFRETVELVSATAGTYIFPLHATCLPPQRQGPIDIKPNNSTTISFRNVFPESVPFQVASDHPSFVVSKAQEIIPGKKSAGFSVAYKPQDSSQTTRGKLTVTGTPTSTGDMQPITWVYYLRGMRDIDVQEAAAAEKASKMSSGRNK